MLPSSNDLGHIGFQPLDTGLNPAGSTNGRIVYRLGRAPFTGKSWVRFPVWLQ